MAERGAVPFPVPALDQGVDVIGVPRRDAKPGHVEKVVDGGLPGLGRDVVEGEGGEPLAEGLGDGRGAALSALFRHLASLIIASSSSGLTLPIDSSDRLFRFLGPAPEGAESRAPRQPKSDFCCHGCRALLFWGRALPSWGKRRVRPEIALIGPAPSYSSSGNRHGNRQ